MKKNVAIILAGGIGKRFNSTIPKQFVEIEDMPVIIHTLKKFELCENIDEILIVCLNSYILLMKELLDKFKILKILDVIPGGNTRHESIRNGINYLKSKNYDNNTKVLLHNANMPLITIENINECLKNCIDRDTIVTSAAKCDGFFYQIENDGTLSIGPDREIMLNAKVPEVFLLETGIEIYNDYEFLQKKYESYTTGMLGIIKNKKVIPVICKSTNKKITTIEDYDFVLTYLRHEKDEKNEK